LEENGVSRTSGGGKGKSGGNVVRNLLFGTRMKSGAVGAACSKE